MTAPIFIRTGVRIKRHQYDAYRKARDEMQQLMKAQKNVEQLISKIRSFRWICDAHAFLNGLTLKMTAALSAKTICNSPLGVF